MARKIGFWFIVAVLVVVTGGGGYLYYNKTQAAPQTSTESEVQTATVRKGNLIISASGTGSVVSAAEVKLSFKSSGQLTELNVAVGDEVNTGDILATLESTESSATLAAQLSSAELAVIKAQKTLDELKAGTDAVTLAQAEVNLAKSQEALDTLLNPSESSIAAAELAVINAQDVVTEAQKAVNYLNYDRGSQEQVEAARAAYLLAQEKVDRMQDMYDRTGGTPEENANKALALSNLAASKTERNRALANLNWFLGTPTEAEIAEKKATLAKAQVAELEQKLADLKAAPDEYDVKLAEAELANAQAQLVVKQEAIARQTIVAPFDGVILAVNAQVGDNVSSSPIITLADMKQPMLEVMVDESDMNSVGLNYAIEVTFDALPNQTFTGHITRIDPSLTSVQNVTAVRALASLDLTSFAKPQTLPIGLNASVEIINSKAEGVLLAPVEALRELSAGKYGVFVMTNGKPVLHIVEVGIMDLTYAEIKSGLNEGDIVTTGIVETNQ